MNLLDIKAFRAIHAEAVGLFGGASALVRNENLFQFSMTRADNLIAYGQPSIPDVAAIYIFGIIDNHPFIDGNRRAGVLAALMFLDKNGMAITASDAEIMALAIEIGTGSMTQKMVAAWMSANLEKKAGAGKT